MMMSSDTIQPACVVLDKRGPQMDTDLEGSLLRIGRREGELGGASR
jgi:hypothetical protein